LGNDSHCHPVEPGCTEYVEGKCTKCLKPFELVSTGCVIDGCAEYEKTGCKNCSAPYIKNATNNKTCRIENCKTAAKGVCLNCELGYSATGSGVCTKDDAVCNTIDSTTGKCKKCSEGFIVNKDGKCEPTKPGCVYSNNECKRCSKPYVMQNGECVILGCKINGEEGCKECVEPFSIQESDKSCAIEACRTYDVDGCKVCGAPYTIQSDKSCKIDKCVKTDNKTCVLCEKGNVLLKGKCFKEDPYCETYVVTNGTCRVCKENATMNETTKECYRKVTPPPPPEPAPAPTPTPTQNNTTPTNTTSTTPIVKPEPPKILPETVLVYPPTIDPTKFKFVRYLIKIKDNNNPLPGEPEPPVGFEHVTYTKWDPVNKKFVVFRPLRPIEDTPTAKPDEPKLPEQFKYDTIEVLPKRSPSVFFRRYRMTT
jgi:hypothetical protein